MNGFKVKLQSAAQADLEFYGIIGGGGVFDGDDYVSAPEVLQTLKEIGKVGTLRIFYNSFGGDAYDGFQIANRLRKLRDDGQIGVIESHAEGIVASAATLPYLAGDVRVMRTGARFMIHKPWTNAAGNSTVFRALADRLDQTEEEAIELYEASSSLRRDEIIEALAANNGAGTYYNPREAKNFGFATDIVEPAAIAACISQEAREALHPGLPDDVPIMTAEERLDAQRMRDAELHPDNWD